MGRVTAPHAAERLDYAELAVSVLAATADTLGAVKGRRKAILYVGEGIDFELGERSMELATRVNHFLATVSRNSVVLYTVDPTGMRAPDMRFEEWSNQDAGDHGRDLDDMARRQYTTLRAWAGDSGGVAVVNTNNLDAGLERIVEDTSRYYVLGYESGAENDGRFHPIEVRTTREGLRVRARRGFVAAPKAPARAAAATPRAPDRLDTALSSPVPAAAARLRLFTAPFKGSGPTHAALVALHVDGRDLALEERGGAVRAAAVVEIVVLDQTGRVAASTRNNVELDVPAARVGYVQSSGLRYVDRVQLPPGRYRVRAGVSLGPDRVGTVLAPLEIPDFSRPGTLLSGLLVSSRRPAPGLSTGAYYTDWLPGPVTADRRFVQDDELTMFAELYHGGEARPLRVLWRAWDEAGQAVLEGEETLDAPRLAVGGPVPLRSSVPLETLSPGRYRFRLEVRDGDAPLASREIVFVVRASDAP